MSLEAGPKRVLIVEDEDAIANLYRAALRKPDYVLDHARNGREAVSLAAGTTFDAIISDLEMPGMNGIELLKSVREHDPDVPIVIVTGKPEVETAITAVEYGALRYLVKPVRLEELRETVARAVEAKATSVMYRRAVQLMTERGGRAAELGERTEAEFARALESLYMAYQPIVRPGGGAVVGYEALLRTEHEPLKNPRDLLAAAEELDAIPELGRRVRSAVASTIETLSEDALVFVNLHARELLDGELYTGNPLKAHARRIVVELTEQASVEGIEHRIDRLRSLGFLFAVDDLGSGYAALTHLVKFEPDFAKIDLHLVRDIDRNTSKRMLVSSLVKLCRELNVQLVCEGVETEAEGRCLLDLGAELLQGYLFAKPRASFAGSDLQQIAESIERLLVARGEPSR